MGLPQSYLPCKMIMKEDNSPKYLQCVCIDQHWLLLLNYVLFSIHILTRLETPETFSSHSVKNLWNCYNNYIATSKHFWPHFAVLHISRGRLKERANFLNFFENKQNGEKSRMLLDASSILLQNLTPTHVNFLRTLTKCWKKRKTECWFSLNFIIRTFQVLLPIFN